MLCYVRSYNLQVVFLGRMQGDCDGGGGLDNFTPLNEGNAHEKGWSQRKMPKSKKNAEGLKSYCPQS